MKHSKRFFILVLSILLVLSFTGCDKDEPSESDNALTEDTSSDTESESTLAESPESTPKEPENVIIELKGKEYAVSEKGRVTPSGNVLCITSPGTYEIKGKLDDAQIRICVEKTEKVDIIFCGVDITNKTSAPFYVESADKVSIELKEGTKNVLTDCKNYVFAKGEDKPNACLYSSEDLTIKGKGSLLINAYYNNGIGCKNDLKIKDGIITVSAPNNAIKGNQSVKIENGKLDIKGADGIKADSIVKTEGVIEILGGEINIRAADDGLQATTSVTVKAPAKVTINASDKDVNCDGTSTVDDGCLISK